MLAQYGLLLVFINVLLTQAGVPVPAPPMLVVAGALAAQGEFGYSALLLIGVVIVVYAGIKLTQRYLFLRMLRAAR